MKFVLHVAIRSRSNPLSGFSRNDFCQAFDVGFPENDYFCGVRAEIQQ